MLKDLKFLPHRMVLLAAGFGTILFFGWLLLFYFLWSLPSNIDDILKVQTSNSTLFWSALQSLSAAGALAVTCSGALFILSQLRATLESRDLDIFKDAFERMMDDKNVEARRWIYMNLPDADQDIDTLEEGLRVLTNNPEGHIHVKRVLNSFDHLGFLVKQKWVQSNTVIEWVSPFVVKTWAKLEPYVNYECERRNEPDYYAAARHLAQQCKLWREKRDLPTRPNWVKNAI